LEANHQQPVALSQTFSASHSDTQSPDAAVEELWTEVEGCRVRYLKCGKGPALVLIHGLLGSAFCWRCNLRELGRVRTVYALDLPGVGYSGRLAERECSVTTNAQRLLEFMQACGLERADLLGNSHGGAVAMMVAALQPQRVSRLILAAPVHPWMRHRRLLIGLAASRMGGWAMQLIAPQLGLLHGYFLGRMYGDPRRIGPGTVEGYSVPIQIPGTVDHLLAMVRCWKEDIADLERVLPQLRSIPTLLLWGSLDRAVNPESAAKLREAFEDCQLEIIPGAGHLPYEEFPPEFNQRVLTFLEHKKSAGL
jgi:pimeloyl-ACP methyl ester carboxylesterase